MLDNNTKDLSLGKDSASQFAENARDSCALRGLGFSPAV